MINLILYSYSRSQSKLSLAAFAMNMKQVPHNTNEYKNVNYGGRDSSMQLSFKPVNNVKGVNQDRVASFGIKDPQSGSNHASPGAELRFTNFYDNIYSKEKSNVLHEASASNHLSVAD